jgi:TolB protein
MIFNLPSRYQIKRFFVGICILILSIAAVSPNTHAQYDYIDITKPFLRKIPVAIPVFKAINRTGQESEIGKKGADILSEVLEFTGYFTMLDRRPFWLIHRKQTLLVQELILKTGLFSGLNCWSHPVVAIQDGILHAELRLFDTFSRKCWWGKNIREPRRISGRSCFVLPVKSFFI